MTEDTGDMVPRSRLNEVIEQRDTARADLTKVTDQANKLSATAMGYKQRLEESEAEKERLAKVVAKAGNVQELMDRAEAGDKAVAEAKALEAKLERQQHLHTTDTEMRAVDDADVRDTLRAKFEAQKATGEGDFAKWFQSEGVQQSPLVRAFKAAAGSGGGDGQETASGSATEAAAGHGDGDGASGGGQNTEAAGGQEGGGADKAGGESGVQQPGNQGVVRTPALTTELDPRQISRMGRKAFQESGLLEKFAK